VTPGTLRNSSLRQSATCYICVKSGADSRDHIVPGGFFPPPRPSNLITLPAHHSCHNRLSEDYARAILAGASQTPMARRVMEDVRRSLRRSDLGGMKLRRDLVRTLIPRLEFRSPSGLYVGNSPGVQFDATRVYPLLQKMVRGLYHHHTGRFLPTEAPFAWGLNERPVGMLETIFAQSVLGLSYPAVFEYRYRIVADDRGELSVWWLRFYEGWIFRCATDTESSAFSAT